MPSVASGQILWLPKPNVRKQLTKYFTFSTMPYPGCDGVCPQAHGAADAAEGADPGREEVPSRRGARGHGQRAQVSWW